MNTLPTQKETDEFIRLFLEEKPVDQVFHLTDLTRETKEFFGVSEEEAARKPAAARNCTFKKFGGTTVLEQLVHWGCIHLVNAHDIKRVGKNEYQHINGNRLALRVQRKSKPSPDTTLQEVTASMTLSKKIGLSLSEAIDMWKSQFSLDILQKVAQSIEYV